MLLYLHGFASGPSSLKARVMRERFGALGIPLEVPDLTPGPEGFERSTPSSMLGVVRARLSGGGPPHALIGSSLGGYLAAVASSLDPSISRLVLLAPAFRLFARWRLRLGESEIAQWRKKGLETLHHESDTTRRLGFAFFEDASTMPEFPSVTIPTLVLAGRNDETVPIGDVRAWVGKTPSARLVELDDGHDLVPSLDRIWDETRAFLAEGEVRT